MQSLTGPEIRKLKALAQRLEPVLAIGKAGVSESFMRSLNEALDTHELVKVKFRDFKEQKKELAPRLAEETGSFMVMRVGNVAVLYRRQPDASKRRGTV